MMSLDNLLKILLAGGSLTGGAFLTALRAKLANTKKKNWLHLSFYVISCVVLLGALLTTIFEWNEIIKPDWYAIIVILIAIVFAILLIRVTNKFLTGKYQFTVAELDPVVNDFSRNADKGNIKLLAGNLDFFGKSWQQMDKHPQYMCLAEESFREIQILCTSPSSNNDKMRYGKILTDFPTVKIKYYQPANADLKVRGRIKTLNNVTHLLIYSKIVPGKYEALELDTANSNGALYSHLWELIWGTADTPTEAQLNEYKIVYSNQK
jgi:hypothetical protein